MSKSFISILETKRKHYIITGKNALQQAIYYDKNGYLADPDDIYKYTTIFKEAMSWSDCKSKNKVIGTELCGHGIHAKCYILDTGSVILSSQNNGHSPLFEFAVLYRKGRKTQSVLDFISMSILRAKNYSNWWKRNKE